VTDLVCEERAGNRIGNGSPKHVARNLNGRDSDRDAQRARRVPKDDGEPGERLDC
jgi:hypothetical protein